MRYHESLWNENFNLGILFIAVLLLNIAELTAIKPEYTEQTALVVLTAYYCCLVFFIHGYVNLCFEYSEVKWNLPKIKLGMNVLLAFMVVSIIFNRSIIASAVATDVSLTKVEGDQYWIFQLYLLAFLPLGIGLLVHGFRKLRSNLSRQRCLVMLISMFPVISVGFIVLIAQEMGSTLTAAVILSFAFTLMLGMLVYTEEKTRLFRLLTFVPFTKERKLHKQLLSQITNCISINDDPSQNSSLNLKAMMKELEGTVVEHVLEYYGGNQKLTASALSVSEATVSRRARAVTRRNEQKDISQDYSTDSIRITP